MANRKSTNGHCASMAGVNCPIGAARALSLSLVGGGAVALLLAAATALAACVGTQCQSGPRYGTTCYSGATVQSGPHDPNTPVAPLPPPGHTGLAGLGAATPAKMGPPPEMLGLMKGRGADGGRDADSDADVDATAKAVAP